jgi:DnaJ-class molecular chaperone
METKNEPKAGPGGCGVFATIVLVVALVLGFTVDVTTCPRCKGHEILYAVATLHECPTCRSKGKVTLAEYVAHELGR